MFQFVCTRCGKKCKNAGGLATHMKTQTKRKVVGSPSLLRFVKRAPAKKFPIELEPVKKKPQQIKLLPKSNPKPFRPRNKSKVTAPLIPSENIPPPSRPQDLLTHSHQIWSIISGLKILFLRVWTSDRQSFVYLIYDIFRNCSKRVFLCLISLHIIQRTHHRWKLRRF